MTFSKLRISTVQVEDMKKKVHIISMELTVIVMIVMILREDTNKILMLKKEMISLLMVNANKI
jgi:hypothetical protein